MYGDEGYEDLLDSRLRLTGSARREDRRLPLTRERQGIPFHLIAEVDPEFHQELASSPDLDEARERLLGLIIRREAYLHSLDCPMDGMERNNSMNCLRVLRNFLSERNEQRSGCSVLVTLVELLRGRDVACDRQSFFLDLLHVLRGSRGCSGIYYMDEPTVPDTPLMHGPGRYEHLDELAFRCLARTMSYSSGLDPSVVRRREENRARILDVLGGRRSDWDDHEWQLRHVLQDADLIGELIELSPDEEEAIRIANEHRVPFGITPYYISLMDPLFGERRDHAIRAQVIPTKDYLGAIIPARQLGGEQLDFMQESKTTPVDLVARRYPLIAIFKPYNSCAQICSYCQRNWEIEGPLDSKALASRDRMEKAFSWFEANPLVQEVLITGGDPLVMHDALISEILGRFSRMRHIRRIRLGTRLPVVLPMRFTERLADIIAQHHSPGEREVCLVTHFEHPYEVTPDSMRAVRSLRKRGLMAYNQQVFTIENCRRFETVALRMALKQIGVDPYYMFNTKGKEETRHFRVPIARILQEIKEEARLIPGIARTDEPVFNLPALGKNHLRAWQHHDLLMLSPEGERIYEFHPWEKNISLAPTYVYRDVSIAEFLERLAARGEDPQDYGSIWYYF